jgi:hypothetical protein
MEQANRIQDYETRNVFKCDVVVGSTFILIIDGKTMVASFPTRKNILMQSLLKVFLFPHMPF